jgi:hypothetical protein
LEPEIHPIAEFIRRYALWAVMPVLILGLYYSFTNHVVNAGTGETGKAALSWLSQGYIGNPYIVPSGPTAHTAPGTVAILATVYHIFDGNTSGARIALSIVATLLYAGSCVLAIRYSLRARFRVPAILAIVTLTCVLPVHMYTDVINYRQWDQPVFGFLLTLLAIGWIDALNDAAPRPRAGWLLTVIGAVGALFAPIVPIIAIIALLHIGLRRKNFRMAVVCSQLILVSLVPWGARNQAMLGQFITSRSNFALELAVGNHDRAEGTLNMNTGRRIHPHDYDEAARRLAKIGELAYMKEMKTLAVDWITANPGKFLALSVKRGWLLLFPTVVDRDPLFSPVKILIIAVTSALALLALCVIACARRPVLPWLVCFGLPMAPYVLTHVSERYAFPVFFVSACLIGTAIDIVIQRKAALAYSR